MQVTEQMLQAGVQKAVDLKILSRARALSPQTPEHELMREILDAAFSAASGTEADFPADPHSDKRRGKAF